MTKQNVRLTTINMLLMGVLLAALASIGWQQVGAQEPDGVAVTSAVVQQQDGEEGEEPIHDCDIIEVEGFDLFEDGYAKVAALFGLDQDGLWAELDSGKTLADIGQSKGVGSDAIVKTLLESEQKLIDELVESGEISAEEAAEWKDESAKWIEFDVKNGYTDPFEVARETLGLSPEAFWDGIDAGQSIAQLAEANQVDAQTVIDAIVAADLKMIDAQVEAGLIDEEEAAMWRADAAVFAAEMVNSTDLFFAENMIFDDAEGMDVFEFDLDGDEPADSEKDDGTDN